MSDCVVEEDANGASGECVGEMPAGLVCGECGCVVVRWGVRDFVLYASFNAQVACICVYLEEVVVGRCGCSVS